MLVFYGRPDLNIAFVSFLNYLLKIAHEITDFEIIGRVVRLPSCIYSVSTYFRLELIEPSAREVESKKKLSYDVFSSLT